VKYGQGNASFTPFMNIHLDKMSTLSDFFYKNFCVEITKEEIDNLKNQILK